MKKRPNRIVPIATVIALVLATLAGAGSVAARATAAPVNTAEPAISGTYVEESTLFATPGTWTGTEPIAYAGQWVRCPEDGGSFDGSNCDVIAGATGQYYELKSADVGRRLRVRVTASNSDGSATAASNPTPVVAAKKVDAPKNTKAPSISGTPLVGSLLTLDRGTWTGSEPITYSYTWARCTSSTSCSAISGATGTQYRVVEADVGRTLRAQVTAKNGVGSASAVSSPTAAVQTPGPPGQIVLPTGERSIPVTSVTGGERLVVANVVFAPNPVTTRDRPINVRIRVKDTRGYVVSGALVFIRSTPRLTTGGDLRVTELDGWVSYDLMPFRTFPTRRGQNVQFFVKAYRAGDPVLAGVSTRRLVQVATLG